ncbi:MAG TPA: hypothetical protein H9867_03950, partial [Candidatus Corynebacterium gallistercoris]|nr:hypothetical protein [Candidatus Corynebacterium gallistercoris]
FASEFLLPQLTILNNVRTNASLSTVLQIRDAFHVSATATAVAINEAGLFSDSAFEFTMRHLSRQGYRTGEPGGLQHQERSRIFPTVFDRSRPKHLTIKQLEAELHIPAEDIHALTFGTQMISLNLKRHEQAESLQ